MSTTLQQIFDRVALHLLRQNEQSVEVMREQPHCMYRGPGNLKCAVGFLISDDAYTVELEGCSAGNVDVLRALEESGIPVAILPNARAMLTNLQNVHDALNPRFWKEELEAVAHMYGLTMPALADEMLPATEERDEPAPAAREVAGAL